MKRKWTLARIQQNIPLFERLTSSPLTEEKRGEGDQGFHRPLTLTLILAPLQIDLEEIMFM